MRHEIRLAGFGGQGIVLAGHLLGKAAALYDDKNAVQTQSYGPEARGGACATEIIICDDDVDFPEVDRADYQVIMSQEAFTKYGPLVKEGGVVILDGGLVQTDTEGDRVYRGAFTRLAEELGNRIVANVVMLGYLTAVTGVVSREAMEQAIRTTVRERVIDLNLRAFSQGFEHAKAGVKA